MHECFQHINIKPLYSISENLREVVSFIFTTITDGFSCFPLVRLISVGKVPLC